MVTTTENKPKTSVPRRNAVPPNAESVGNKQVPPRSNVPPKQETQSTPPNRPGKYVETVEQFYGVIGMAAMPFAPKLTETIFDEFKLNENDDDEEPKSRAHHLGVAWDEYAQTNPSVRRFLDKMSGTSPMAKIVLLHAPLVATAASELGLFSQVGKLMNKFRENRNKSTEETPYNNGFHSNPEFGRTSA